MRRANLGFVGVPANDHLHCSRADYAAHEAFATLASGYKEPQDGVAMQACDPFSRAHRATFHEKLNSHDAARVVQVVFDAECRSVILSEGLAAGQAVVALQSVAVFSKTLGFGVAGRAFHGGARGGLLIHVSIIQRSLAHMQILYAIVLAFSG
jgi:hypothetical protein